MYISSGLVYTVACDLQRKTIAMYTENCTIQTSDRKIEKLWEQFEDGPMNPDTECMDASFLGFPAGTHREEIWHWFDEQHSKGVAYLLYNSF